MLVCRSVGPAFPRAEERAFYDRTGQCQIQHTALLQARAEFPRAPAATQQVQTGGVLENVPDPSRARPGTTFFCSDHRLALALQGGVGSDPSPWTVTGSARAATSAGRSAGRLGRRGAPRPPPRLQHKHARKRTNNPTVTRIRTAAMAHGLERVHGLFGAHPCCARAGTRRSASPTESPTAPLGGV